MRDNVIIIVISMQNRIHFRLYLFPLTSNRVPAPLSATYPIGSGIFAAFPSTTAPLPDASDPRSASRHEHDDVRVMMKTTLYIEKLV